MISPLGLAMLLLPATSRQQIIYVVCAGTTVGKFCVIALGQNSWNCARLNGTTLGTGWAIAISAATMSEVTAAIQIRDRDKPIIDAALPCRRGSPPSVSSGRYDRERRDAHSLFSR